MGNRTIVAGILLIPALAIAYYFAVALPENQKASLVFEKQKYADQRAKEQAKADQAEEDERIRIRDLGSCLLEASQNYDKDIRINGKPGASGSYQVDVAVANGIQHRKEAAVAECHRLYGK